MSEILELYRQCLKYDLDKFSEPWMYWWLLIPALCYMFFFFVKWTVITAPFWLPFAILLQAAKGTFYVRVFSTHNLPKESKAD